MKESSECMSIIKISSGWTVLLKDYLDTNYVYTTLFIPASFEQPTDRMLSVSIALCKFSHHSAVALMNSLMIPNASL